MANVKTQVTQTAEKKIQYRFTCEDCGHTTDWFDGKITAKADITYKGVVYSSDSRVQNNSTLNTAANKNLIAEIRDIEERLEKGAPINMRLLPKNKCPKCRKVQSWSEAIIYNAMTISLLVVILLASLGLGIVLNAGFLSIFVILFTFLILMGIVVGIRNRQSVKCRKEVMAKSGKSLEINWLDGTPPIKY
ncbi:MAG: hypothetical protein LBL83_10005 [Clostridiales bacterium]|nr:hypothetical protein [Clostridiales bacterium]